MSRTGDSTQKTSAKTTNIVSLCCFVRKNAYLHSSTIEVPVDHDIGMLDRLHSPHSEDGGVL